MVEETFEFQSSGMLQNKGFSRDVLMNSFAMVEENFEFQSSGMLQNEGFSWDELMNTFTMLKKMLSSSTLK